MFLASSRDLQQFFAHFFLFRTAEIENVCLLCLPQGEELGLEIWRGPLGVWQTDH